MSHRIKRICRYSAIYEAPRYRRSAHRSDYRQGWHVDGIAHSLFGQTAPHETALDQTVVDAPVQFPRPAHHAKTAKAGHLNYHIAHNRFHACHVAESRFGTALPGEIIHVPE